MSMIITQPVSTSVPTASKPAGYTPGGFLRGAISSYLFSKTAVPSATTQTMNYGVAGCDLIISVGWKLDLYSISIFVSSNPDNAQVSGFKLLVDAVDVSASSHPTLSVTGTAGADGALNASVDASPFPYTIDATSATKRVNLSLANGSGQTCTASATIYGCCYKP